MNTDKTKRLLARLESHSAIYSNERSIAAAELFNKRNKGQYRITTEYDLDDFINKCVAADWHFSQIKELIYSDPLNERSFNYVFIDLEEIIKYAIMLSNCD